VEEEAPLLLLLLLLVEAGSGAAWLLLLLPSSTAGAPAAAADMGCRGARPGDACRQDFEQDQRANRYKEEGKGWWVCWVGAGWVFE
jgi:hypothetical protein